MKKMGLLALLVGAALFTGLGATSALAESGKCGAEKKSEKCGTGKAAAPGKCSGEKAMPIQGKCSGEKAAPMQGKCDSEKKEKIGKCGAGKCGK